MQMVPRPWARALAVVMTALLHAACAAAPPAPAAETTYIREFTHPRVVVHYHPRAGMQFLSGHVRYALENGAHGLELDLHMRGGDVVCNHDGPTPESPRLADVVDIIAEYQGDRPTVHGDGRQFFLVLEPKDDDPRVYEQVFKILGQNLARLSTSARPGGGPRGITVVVTGGNLGAMLRYFEGRRADLNRRCILENHDYTGEIRNLSDGAIPFQWTAIQYPRQMGRVNALHSGTDPGLRGKYNVRVWGIGAALGDVLASGVDSINCDHEQVVPFQEIVRHQTAAGARPALAVRGKQAILAWRDAASGDLYIAMGSVTKGNLAFPRQISLTAFLTERPKAVAPAVAILPDGRLLIVFEDPVSHALAYVSGRFTRPDRFLTFEGAAHVLETPSGAPIVGADPAVTAASDGRVAIIYTTPDGARLGSLVGWVGADGKLIVAGETISIGMSPL